MSLTYDCSACGETYWPSSPGAYTCEGCGGALVRREIVMTEPIIESRMKSKANRIGNGKGTNAFDRCQTPAYALEPLYPYLDPTVMIWEPAQGEGILAEAFRQRGYSVLATDLLDDVDFFTYNPGPLYITITNPPFSQKYLWLARCYELCNPFALLLPLETLGAAKAQCLFEENGVEIILLDKRVNFKMPYKGWGGKGAQFPVAWFTHGLGIGRELTYAHLERVIPV